MPRCVYRYSFISRHFPAVPESLGLLVLQTPLTLCLASWYTIDDVCQEGTELLLDTSLMSTQMGPNQNVAEQRPTFVACTPELLVHAGNMLMAWMNILLDLTRGP